MRQSREAGRRHLWSKGAHDKELRRVGAKRSSKKETDHNAKEMGEWMQAGTQGLTFVKSLDGREGTGYFVSITVVILGACSWVRIQTLVIGKFGFETQPQHWYPFRWQGVEPSEF